MASKHEYWFPSKRYGWGWGLPTCWQGWTVLLTYFALAVIAAIVVQPARHLSTYIAVVALLTLALVAVCWLKGEPPRWRWGQD